jgi:hypothetical protein
MKTVTLLSQIYFCNSISTDSISRRTAPLHFATQSGQFAVVSLFIFAVRLLKPSLAVLRNCALLISFCLQIFSELLLLFSGSTHLCFNLLIGTKVPLQSALPSANGDQFGVATVLDLMLYRLLALQLASLYLKQH